MNVVWIIFLVMVGSISIIQGSSIEYQKLREDVKPSLAHGLLIHQPPVGKSNEKSESLITRRHAKTRSHPHTRNGRCFSWLLNPNFVEDVVEETTYNPIYDLDPRMNLLRPSQAYLYFPYAYSKSNSRSSSSYN